MTFLMKAEKDIENPTLLNSRKSFLTELKKKCENDRLSKRNRAIEVGFAIRLCTPLQETWRKFNVSNIHGRSILFVPFCCHRSSLVVTAILI